MGSAYIACAGAATKWNFRSQTFGWYSFDKIYYLEGQDNLDKLPSCLIWTLREFPNLHLILKCAVYIWKICIRWENCYLHLPHKSFHKESIKVQNCCKAVWSKLLKVVAMWSQICYLAVLKCRNLCNCTYHELKVWWKKTLSLLFTDQFGAYFLAIVFIHT